MPAVGSITNFPAALQPIIQQNFLDRELLEGLDAVYGFRRVAFQEVINAGIGETITKSKKGRKAPTTTPVPASSITGLDDGLTPAAYAVEQFSLTLNLFGDTVDVDWVASQTMIADHMLAAARNNGEQAAHSLERRARQQLYSAYLGGNSRVRTDLGASSTTTCHVDDMRGFQFVLVNGVPTAVGGGTNLTVVESGTTPQTLTVTSISIDGSSSSNVPDGLSGVITFSAASAPTNVDTLVAAGSSKVIWAGGKTNTAQITPGDVFTA